MVAFGSVYCFGWARDLGLDGCWWMFWQSVSRFQLGALELMPWVLVVLVSGGSCVACVCAAGTHRWSHLVPSDILGGIGRAGEHGHRVEVCTSLVQVPQP